MVPLILAAALSTPPAHVVAYDQSAPQTTIVWGAAPGIFWTTADEGAQSTQTPSDQPQSSNADPQQPQQQQPQLIPFGLTTL